MVSVYGLLKQLAQYLMDILSALSNLSSIVEGFHDMSEKKMEWYGTKISNMEFRMCETLADEHEAVRLVVDQLDDWNMRHSVSYGPRMVKQGMWKFYKAPFSLLCVFV